MRWDPRSRPVAPAQERSANAIDAGVRVHVERARAAGDGALGGKVKDRRGGELGEYSAHDGVHGGCERKIDLLLKKRGDRADPPRHVARECVVVRQTSQPKMKLFQVSGGMGIIGGIRADIFSAFGCKPAGEIKGHITSSSVTYVCLCLFGLFRVRVRFPSLRSGVLEVMLA